MSSNGITFNAQEFTAFPTYITTSNLGSSTFIGVGQNYGGVGNVIPVPVENNIVKYLIDGANGLDLGTGIFNFPKSGEISYDITSINPFSVGAVSYTHLDVYKRQSICNTNSSNN